MVELNLSVTSPRPIGRSKEAYSRVQHTSGKDLITPIDIPTVSIPKVDHDNLVSLAYQGMASTANVPLLVASYGPRI